MSEQKLIKSKILQRIDDEQNWTSVNPILSSAEIVFSRTQNGTFMKLGDGRHYLDTPFYQDIKIDESQISSLKFVHISKEEYELLVTTSSVNESTIYFLSGDLDAYGRRIMNVKDATDISDAVNLEQVTQISSFLYQHFDGLMGNLESLINSL